jgi:hypothetical protein
MSQQWKALLGIAEEWAFGSFTIPTRRLGVRRGQIGPIRIGEESSDVTRNRYTYKSTLLGINEEFSLEMWGHSSNLGEILKWTFGTVSPSGVGALYQHDYAVADDLRSFSISVDTAIATNPTLIVAGCKVNTLTLENAARSPLTVTVEGIAKWHMQAPALTALVGADHAQFARHPFRFHHLAFSKGLSGVARSADTTVERVSVTINNNLIPDVVTADQSLYINKLPEGEIQVTGAFDKEFANYDEFDVFIANEQLDLQFTWTDANGHILRITLPNCRITALPHPENAGGNERMMVTIEFVALYDTTSSGLMTGRLTNDVDDYSSRSSSSSSSSLSSSSSSSSSSG